MAEVPKAVLEREVDCPPHKFYEWVKYSFHHLPTVLPGAFTDCQILEGDGGSEGCLRQWKYILPGSTEEHVMKTRTTKQDDENMVIALFAEEGNVHDHYQHFTGIVQVTPKGNGSLVKWTLEYKKHNDESPDPHLLLELCDKVTDKIDAHLQTVDK